MITTPISMYPIFVEFECTNDSVNYKSINSVLINLQEISSIESYQGRDKELTRINLKNNESFLINDNFKLVLIEIKQKMGLIPLF